VVSGDYKTVAGGQFSGRGWTSILGAYALGKAQRLLTTVNPDIGPILTHDEI
jgi:Cft2 family RNA processing exonuclease